MVWKPVLQTEKGSLLGNILEGPGMKFDGNKASQELTIFWHYFLMHALHCFKAQRMSFADNYFLKIIKFKILIQKKKSGITMKLTDLLKWK